MKVKIPGLGMFLFLKPVLAAWCVRMGYEMPDITPEHLECYYVDELPTAETRGTCRSYRGTTVIQIRPGIYQEIQTWAHEFAHMIQAINLGKSWFRSYNTQTEENGYWNNIYEVEAREAGKMAFIFEKQGWLFWEVDYNYAGEFTPWAIKVKPCLFTPLYQHFKLREYYQRIILPYWAKDWYKLYVPAAKRLAILVKTALELFPGYPNFNAVTNMQQYAA